MNEKPSAVNTASSCPSCHVHIEDLRDHAYGCRVLDEELLAIEETARRWGFDRAKGRQISEWIDLLGAFAGGGGILAVRLLEHERGCAEEDLGTWYEQLGDLLAPLRDVAGQALYASTHLLEDADDRLMYLIAAGINRASGAGIIEHSDGQGRTGKPGHDDDPEVLREWILPWRHYHLGTAHEATETERETCPTCRRPVATDEEWETVPGGERPDLCWGGTQCAQEAQGR